MVDFSKLATPLINNNVVTVGKFARRLGQPATTLKRLFAAEVLNPRLVQKTAGKHWRICFSSDDLRNCAASIAIWRALRRKPRIARTYAVRDAVQKLAIDLLLSEEINSRGAIHESPREKVEAYTRAFYLLKTKPRNSEAIRWYEQMLDSPQIFAGTFILRVAIETYRAKNHRDPKQNELARELKLSESSLYRPPFKRGPLHFAYFGRIGGQIGTGRPGDDDQNESYIHESEEELSREKRLSRRQKVPPSGFREVKRRSAIGEETRRKLRKRKTHSLEIAWEEHHVGNIQGGALLVFQSDKLQAKRRIEMIERRHGDSDSKSVVKRHSRQLRGDLVSQACDETFGSWALAAYIIQPEGNCHWWTNFNRTEGYADSPRQARREILRTLTKARLRLRIANLDETLGEDGLD